MLCARIFAGVMAGVLLALPVSGQEKPLSGDGGGNGGSVTPPAEISAPIARIDRAAATSEPPAPQADPATAQHLAAVEQRLTAIETRLDQLMDYLNVPTRSEAARPVAADDSMSVALARLEEKLEDLQRSVESMQTHVVARQPVPDAATPTEGTVVLQNWTGSTQYVAVNGERLYAPPGRTERTVPLGPVEVYLPGTEVPRRYQRDFFRWNGEEYAFQVDIRQ